MVGRLINRFQNTRLKSKLFFSFTLVILLISIPIALFTRWILITSLTSELNLRGTGIASSIAEKSRSYILMQDLPNLTNLLFEARLGERQKLVSYIFVLDKQDQILAHTFIRPFPRKLAGANWLTPDQELSIRLIRNDGEAVYDIAVPVREGIYKIGSVRLGVYKQHIDRLISKLRSMFLGFVSVMLLFCFIISHRLSGTITRPFSKLTQMAEAVSHGNYETGQESEDAGFGMAGHDIAADNRDEIQQMAHSVFHMTRQIKKSQIQLRESEQKYRSLIAGGPNPVLVIDRRTTLILDANPAAERCYGYRRDELLDKPLSILGPFDLQATVAGGGSRTPTGPISVSSKVRYFRKNGSELFVNVHASPLSYAGRDALIVATSDITEMVEKDNQLIQFSKLKTLGEMSAGIAHELNQPLNAIKMGSEFLEMMQQRRLDVAPADMMVVVSEISNQVDRATEIIRRLRDFGRKSDLTRELVPLNQPIRSVLTMLGRQMALQNIVVELDLAKAPLVIRAHPNRLEQVFFNLLTNARDALNQKCESVPDSKRTIHIRTATKNTTAVAEVADTGTGIPKQVRQRIFEAFFTTKEMGEGMGLGLSICHGIVADYGGRISIESEEGQGTTFRLTFPLAEIQTYGVTDEQDA
jgi:two-component system NtrC family sensor kinase